MQAIFESCCSIVPSSPVLRVRVKLRDPSLTEADLEDSSGAEVLASHTPSSVFSLDCTLPAVRFVNHIAVFLVG